jgi:hypothetical protein
VHIRPHILTQHVGAVGGQFEQLAELDAEDLYVGQQLADMVADHLGKLLRRRQLPVQDRPRRRRDRLSRAIDQFVEGLAFYLRAGKRDGRPAVDAAVKSPLCLLVTALLDR